MLLDNIVNSNTLIFLSYLILHFTKMQDIWSVISEFIPEGSWKDFIFTCKMFLSFNTLERIKKKADHLLTLIKMYPDAS